MVAEVDLDATKPANDKKTYRHFTLHNGIECVLISNPNDQAEDDDTSDEEDEPGDSWNEQATSSGSDNDDEENEDDGGGDGSGSGSGSGSEAQAEDNAHARRQSAVAIAVPVGSWSDPEICHGLAHFLEHLLFMGSSKYPQENYFDEYVSRRGGFVNAYTKAEETVYHFTINKHGLFHAMDILAQFFIDPLLSRNAVDRELDSIQSEFDSAGNSLSNRLEELLSHTASKSHPASKFSWGNLDSIKGAPAAKGVDAYELLWEFYRTHYATAVADLKVVVISSHSLQELQQAAAETFGEIRTLDVDSRVGSDQVASSVCHGLPYKEEKGLEDSFHKLLYVIPVLNVHKLQISFQLPALTEYYKSKPQDYLAHFIGHECIGSIHATAKEKGWANALLAGDGGDVENASFCFFDITLSLTEQGLSMWTDVVALVFEYMGMLAKAGCLQWAHEELQDIAAMDYRFSEEEDPDETVSNVAEAMLPGHGFDRQDILTGEHLITEYNPGIIQQMLDKMQPEHCRVHVVSKRIEEEDFVKDQADLKEAERRVEPKFGTVFWSCEVDTHTLSRWQTAYATGQNPLVRGKTPSGLALPRQNPYVAKSFDLHPFPSDNPAHPLVGAWVKLKRSSKQKAKLPYRKKLTNAFVVECDVKNERLKVIGDGFEEWHQFSLRPEETAGDSGVETLCLDNNKTKCRLLEGGNGGAQKFTVENIWTFSSPPLAPVFSPTLCPKSGGGVEIWTLRDRVFLVPRIELWVNLALARPLVSAEDIVVTDLLCMFIRDALNEDVYMASIAELNMSISRTLDGNLSLRFAGFNDKLLELLTVVLDEIPTTCEVNEASPQHTEEVLNKRHKRLLESMERGYSNICMVSSSFAKRTRLECLRPTCFSPQEMRDALEAVSQLSLSELAARSKDILAKLCVKAFIHGNFSESDVSCVHEAIVGMKTKHGLQAALANELPEIRILSMPMGQSLIVQRDIENPLERNNCVEAYFEIANLAAIELQASRRTKMILELIETVMDEPLYDELRTQQQLGYNVSCSTRHNKDIIGFLIKVVSATHRPAVIIQRINAFLAAFAGLHLAPMQRDKRSFGEQLGVLAELKLADEHNLTEESELHSDEIISGSYDFHRAVKDAHALDGIKAEEVVESFNKWLSPLSPHRKSLFVCINNTKGKDTSEVSEEAGEEEVGDVEPSAPSFVVKTPRDTLHSGTYGYHTFLPKIASSSA